MKLGDGIAGMAGLESGSVDLVLTDLPSGQTAAKFDKPVNLPDFWAACWHALKPTGVVWVMASSLRFAAELVNSQPKHFRYDLVWSKTTATGFMNSKIAPLRAHEFILVFYRKLGTYNIEMVEVGTPIHFNSTKGRTHGENYGAMTSKSGIARVGATDRFPQSVIQFRSLGVRHPDRVHPQQKPEELFRWAIRVYSNPGELVVDPCAGSGTTERAAFAESRRSICWDIAPRFGKRRGQQPLHFEGEVA